MSEANDAIEVRDAPDASRYELFSDGERAGLAAYRRADGVITFTHTEIDDRFEGKGLGGKLVKFALDAARTSGERVAPQCPFVASYIERHPEYADLVQRG
jgi:predicted GNAT family acetyltransferase